MEYTTYYILAYPEYVICIALFKNSWQQDLLPVLKISV